MPPKLSGGSTVHGSTSGRLRWRKQHLLLLGHVMAGQCAVLIQQETGMEDLQRRLLEAERREEEQKKRAEEAERDRRRERERAEQQQQRAEEADRERERERERAEQQQQRAEQQQQRAEQQQQRAEQQQQRAEQQQQRAEEAEEQTRRTTLDEYIAHCHHYLFSSLQVERDRTLTSKGSITNPRDKLCPTNLVAWPRFLEQQRDIFDTLYGRFPLDARVFESRSFLVGLGRRVAQRPIGDEKTLEYFMHNSVEDPVRELVEQLQQTEAVRDAFDMGNGIVFENHPQAISDAAEEVADRSTPVSPHTPDHRRDLHKLRPDQICIYRSGDETRKMIYVAEYKAPHKLTPQSLRAGLRPMNIYRDVVNRKTIPPTSDTDARFRYHAERLTASALTQAYHYIIEGGLDYGLLTTGEATVFLKVDWADPGTLYYHLAEPGPEVSAHPEHEQSSSAVGQYLAFSLMALGQPGARMEHGQDERDRAAAGLRRWAVDFETTLRSIPDSERVASDSGSSWAPTTYEDFDRSPATRKRGRRPSSTGDDGDRFHARRDESTSSDDEAGSRRPNTPSPLERRQQQRQDYSREPRRSERNLSRRPRQATDEECERQYCTQGCLRGLVQGDNLDLSCPNVKSHGKPRRGANCHHPISHSTWLQHLERQLRQTLDRGVVKLGVHGARGVLFKVTLLAYGYTFVCKGTAKAFIPDLEHEAAVYKRLTPLQGKHVPVFLGAIDLRSLKRTYYYDHRVYIVHMTFMSYGGERLEAAKLTGDESAILEARAVESLRAMHGEGVVHQDVRSANMLFNREADSVMVIDFERSLLLQPVRQPLAQMVGNKRRKMSDASKAPATADSVRRKKRRTEGVGFQQDVLMAKTLFCTSGRIGQ